jgi:hypothetical protein
MRIVRIILTTLSILAAVCLLAVVGLWLLKSPYLRFVEEDQKYYSQVARACDLIREQHPLGTNEFVRLSGGDASVPSIIRDLRPSAITIASNRVHVMAGVRDFGMSWEAQEGDTNLWALNVYPAWQGKALYVEKR